ncbi:MAG: hypothetical protein GEV06_07195 [Luteitalea sp.]|nr:hypothetical protein [Luteitalea sp.]
MTTTVKAVVTKIVVVGLLAGVTGIIGVTHAGQGIDSPNAKEVQAVSQIEPGSPAAVGLPVTVTNAPAEPVPVNGAVRVDNLLAVPTPTQQKVMQGFAVAGDVVELVDTNVHAFEVSGHYAITSAAFSFVPSSSATRSVTLRLLVHDCQGSIVSTGVDVVVPSFHTVQLTYPVPIVFPLSPGADPWCLRVEQPSTPSKDGTVGATITGYLLD